MPTLVEPTVAVHRSFLLAWDEFEPEVQSRWMGAETYIGGETERWDREQLAEPAEFERFVAETRGSADPDAVLADGIVPYTSLWLVDGDEWLGRLSLRHELTPPLLELGGHIGYCVRPSARRRGYATQMLVQSLPVAARLGIDPALLTCDADNDASRRVIQAAGGEFEDERHGKLRFWVATHTS
ncbi:GNAT family N-acetyltransferase [Kribbella antibiotica]|uniref:GNAT family N-acetyltransferase n=1 Tax=Kribbella antibiotica TaxID=190195 RepID=A0A4R4ZLI6_9ACTN|nr:GNAT family N-acetyltransferase [Kribbella antibiotica]TDD59080.1 GNAT family N-acetyltransferase [Kribbella antibiotica]